ncbi:MAG: tyrosine-type recombinase/integrase [Ilumatobacteraceae bacterium]
MVEPKTKAPVWRSTAIPGLYQRANGLYYHRYSVGGKRTWRSLETDNFTVAKLKLAKQTGAIETARQSGTTINSDLRTLGALSQQFLTEVNLMDIAPSTKIQYGVWLQRLRLNWEGEFDSTLARNVNRDVILRLRKRLGEVKVRVGKSERKGYTPASINQTLSALRLLLELAVRGHIIAKSPFAEKGIFNDSYWLADKPRRPDIPANADMERVFAELERAEPDAPEWVKRQHIERGRFARFLAYTGCRLHEATAATFDDVTGDWIRIHGTKTDGSERTIPVIPPLRTLLEAIRADRPSGAILTVQEVRDHLGRACEALKLGHLRHHDLRHYFATACVESGVPIPTVADWLGHVDGGALLMQRYRHLRDKHSLEAAKLVTMK